MTDAKTTSVEARETAARAADLTGVPWTAVTDARKDEFCCRDVSFVLCPAAARGTGIVIVRTPGLFGYSPNEGVSMCGRGPRPARPVQRPGRRRRPPPAQAVGLATGAAAAPPPPPSRRRSRTAGRVAGLKRLIRPAPGHSAVVDRTTTAGKTGWWRRRRFPSLVSTDRSFRTPAPGFFREPRQPTSCLFSARRQTMWWWKVGGRGRPL